MHLYSSRVKNRSGFTLIELLIVIAILAILALIGLPRLAGFVDDSQAEEVRATGVIIGRSTEALIALDPSITGNIDQATIGPYLDPESAARVGAEFTIVVDDGVEVEYIGGSVTLDDNIVYNSQSD